MIPTLLIAFSNTFRNTELHLETGENFDELKKINEAQSGRGQNELETTGMRSKAYCIIVYPNRFCRFLVWRVGDNEVSVEIGATNKQYYGYPKSGKSQPNKAIFVTCHVLS